MQEIRDVYLPQLEDFNGGGEEGGALYTPILQALKDFIDRFYKRPEGMYSKARKLLSARISNPLLLKKAREVIRQSKESYDAERRAAQVISEYRNRTQTVLAMDYINEVELPYPTWTPVVYPPEEPRSEEPAPDTQSETKELPGGQF